MNYKKQFEDKGFVIVKNLITETQLKDLRMIINNHFENCEKRMETLSFFNKNPHIYELQFNNELIKICKEIFGEKFVVNNSIQIQYNMFGINDKYLGWHIDCGHEYSSSNYKHLYNNNYRFAKIGIYLQDNTLNFGGGIDVLNKSHKVFKLKSKFLTRIYFKILLTYLKRANSHKYTLFTKAGDAVIFDSRLMHRSTINLKTRSNSTGASRNFNHNSENSKISIYWSMGNKFSDEYFKQDMIERANEEYSQKAEEVVYNEYLSFYYPDSYPDKYISSIKKNKLNVSSLHKKETIKYRNRLANEKL